jgi:hypothetical protein
LFIVRFAGTLHSHHQPAPESFQWSRLPYLYSSQATDNPSA